MREVILARLIELLPWFSIESGFSWIPNESPISLEEIRHAQQKGIKAESRPYGDAWKYDLDQTYTRETHIARVLHFVEHPEEIVRIHVDNRCEGMYVCPECVIVDGWHRLLAALVLGFEKISVVYNGREDIEDYLSGKIDVCPVD